MFPILLLSLPFPKLTNLPSLKNISQRSIFQKLFIDKTNLLLIDDADGRKVAQSMDLKITGTVGILLMAAKDKKLDLKNSLDYLLAEGFKLSEKEYQRILKLL